ncbi:MAG: hypothetical protein KBT31_03670 [Firmicutes bacterium]|nr:hypothetical protein [Candidatus Colimorpha enterica]
MNFLLIWLPFIIVLALPLIIWSIGGYRRGALGALIMMLGTAFSAVIAVVLSKLLSGLGGSLSGFLLKKAGELAGEYSALLEGEALREYASGLAKALLACVIFTVIFPFLEPIIRALTSFLAPTVRKKKKAVRLTGAVIGIADAFLFAFLMLSPYYSLLGDASTALGNLAENGVIDGSFLDGDLGTSLPVKLSKSGLAPGRVLMSEKVLGEELDFSEEIDKLTKIKDLSGITELVTGGGVYADIVDGIIPGGSAVVEIADALEKGDEIKEPVKKLLLTDGEELKKSADKLTAMFGGEGKKVIVSFADALGKTNIDEGSAEGEAEKVAYVISALKGADLGSVASVKDIADDPEKLINSALTSDVIVNTLTGMGEGGLPDMSGEAKSEIVGLINGFISENAGNAKATENAEKIKKLFE